MNKSIENKHKNHSEKTQDINRRDALKKMGYAAFASSTMLLLLNNPTMANCCSDPTDPGGGWDFGAKGSWGGNSEEGYGSENTDNWDNNDWGG